MSAFGTNDECKIGVCKCYRCKKQFGGIVMECNPCIDCEGEDGDFVKEDEYCDTYEKKLLEASSSNLNVY